MLLLFIVIDKVLNLYMLVLVGAAVFSWLYAFNIVNPNSAFVGMIARFFYSATEPVLRPIRRILPDFGPIDLSPMVVFLLIWLIESLMQNVLYPMFA